MTQVRCAVHLLGIPPVTGRTRRPLLRGRGSQDVDWLLDTGRDNATKAAVQAVEDHLFRHTIDESRVRDAVEAAETALASAAGPAVKTSSGCTSTGRASFRP